MFTGILRSFDPSRAFTLGSWTFLSFSRSFFGLLAGFRWISEYWSILAVVGLSVNSLTCVSQLYSFWEVLERSLWSLVGQNHLLVVLLVQLAVCDLGWLFVTLVGCL